MGIKRLFGEYVPEGKVSTPKSLRHNRLANFSAFVMIGGMALGVFGLKLTESHPTKNQDDIVLEAEATRFGGFELMLAGAVGIMYNEHKWKAAQEDAKNYRDAIDIEIAEDNQ